MVVALKIIVFWDITVCNVRFTNIPEEHAATIFRIEDLTE